MQCVHVFKNKWNYIDSIAFFSMKIQMFLLLGLIVFLILVKLSVKLWHY